MAIMNMKRMEILGVLSDRKAILETVQRNGKLQVETCEEQDTALQPVAAFNTIVDIDKQQQALKDAEEILNMYVPYKGRNMLESYAPLPDMTVSEYYEKSKSVIDTYNKCLKISALYKEIQDCRVEITRNETIMDQVRPWAKLDISSAFKGTATTSWFIGYIPETLDREAVLTRLVEQIPEVPVEVEVVSSEKNVTCLVALCHKENKKDLEQALRNIGFVAPTDPSKGTPAERLEKLEAGIAACNDKIAENEEALKAFGEKWEDFKFLEDYFVMRKDKYQALDSVLVSKNTFILSGCIPEKYVSKLVSKLESNFDVAISVTDVEPEDDTVPVALENNWLGATMESITKMYATPSHRDIDPNFFMTVFYFSLFGLMLGDAGYGILMIIVCLFVKLKYKPEGAKRNSINYGLLCGIGTTVWGFLLKGFFGDLPAYIANGLKNNDPTDFISVHHLYWFEPLQHTTRFLLLCFFIGILHLMFGVCVAIYRGFKKHNGFNALVENVPLLMILVGVLPLIKTQIGGNALAENPPTVWLDNLVNNVSGVLYGLLAAGAILVVIGPAIIALKDKQSFGKCLGAIGGGLYGLYSAASGYLGDILSYARLLALGLCTGVIASVVNQLAAMLGNPVLFVIVAIFGHTINFGINLIGTYVHTNRLQYVEFFGKFYEGGGIPYEPLSVNSKSFKFKEEI